MTAVALTILGGLLANLKVRIREWRSWYQDQIDPIPVTSQKKSSWGTNKSQEFCRAWTTEHYSRGLDLPQRPTR